MSQGARRSRRPAAPAWPPGSPGRRRTCRPGRSCRRRRPRHRGRRRPACSGCRTARGPRSRRRPRQLLAQQPAEPVAREAAEKGRRHAEPGHGPRGVERAAARVRVESAPSGADDEVDERLAGHRDLSHHSLPSTHRPPRRRAASATRPPVAMVAAHTDGSHIGREQIGQEGLMCHLIPWPARTRCSASPNSSRESGADSSGRGSITPPPISSTAGAKLRRIAIDPVTVISSL